MAYYRSRKREIEEQIADFDESERFAGKLKSTIDKIDKFKQDIDEAVNADRGIGSTFSESGCKLLPGNTPGRGCLVDWGLVQLKAERTGVNMFMVRITNPIAEEMRLTKPSIKKNGEP